MQVLLFLFVQAQAWPASLLIFYYYSSASSTALAPSSWRSTLHKSLRATPRSLISCASTT